VFSKFHNLWNFENTREITPYVGPMRLPDTNINQRFGDKSLIRIRMRDSDRTMSVDWSLFQTLSYSPKLPNPFYLCFQFSIYEVVYLDGEITLVLVTNLFSPKVNNVVYSYKWSVVILRSPDEFKKKIVFRETLLILLCLRNKFGHCGCQMMVFLLFSILWLKGNRKMFHLEFTVVLRRRRNLHSECVFVRPKMPGFPVFCCGNAWLL
jgi:hypothetical protein